MFQVQHFVVEDVLDGVTRHSRIVEDAADDDGIVGGIVVAEAAAGVVLAPGKLGASEESVEKAAVEFVEDFFEVVVVSAGRADVLAPAHLADEAGFGGNVVSGNVAAIAGAVGAIDRLAIKLGEQDVGDGVEDVVGRAFEQVGDADEELSLAHADGVVDGNERIEASVHSGCRRAGAQFAVGFVEDFGELWGHVEGRVAEAAVSRQLSAVRKTLAREYVERGYRR